MKTLTKFKQQAEDAVNEMDASTTTADVANPDVPMFAGARVFSVPTNVFVNARLGKKKYAKWYNYVDEDNGGAEIREYGIKNPKAPIVLQDQASGAMMYLRYGRS